MKMKKLGSDAEHWAEWLEHFGAERFYNLFLKIAQDAKSRCAQCDEAIYLDIAEGGGVPDWKTMDGDYGCPNTFEGCGDHMPERLK